MRKYKLELFLLVLTICTFLIWYFNINLYLRLIIYGLLFFIFTYRKEISISILVILFSVFSNHFYKSTILVDYILIVLLFLYVLYLIIKNKKIIIGNLLLPLIIYLIYNIISLFWTPRIFIGVEGVIAIFEGYLLYFIATNTLHKLPSYIIISKIVSFLLLTITLEILTIYYQYGLSKILIDKRLIHLGWANPNIVASLYCLLIPISLYKYLKKPQENIKLFYLLIYSLIDLTNFLGLALTLSRGAYLGVIIGLLIFTIRFGYIFFKSNKKLLILSIILILSSIKHISSFLLKYFNTYNIFDSNNRFKIYQLALTTFKKKPIFGLGVKSSEFLIRNKLNLPYNHYHNFILQIASTLGLIGLILFSFIVLKWIKVLNNKANPFFMICQISIIGALIHQSLDVSFDLYFFGVYFYLIIALVEVYRYNDVNDELYMNNYQFKDNNR